MSRKVMKHLNNQKLITSDHSDVCSIRKDKLQAFEDKGFEVIEEGDDVYLVGKPMIEEAAEDVTEVKKPVVRKKTAHRK